jgi:hypothetical protein
MISAGLQDGEQADQYTRQAMALKGNSYFAMNESVRHTGA